MVNYSEYPRFFVERAVLRAIGWMEDEKVYNHLKKPLPTRRPEELAAVEYPFMRDFTQEILPVSDGTQLALWIRPPDDERKPVYVVFHGRHGNWDRAGLEGETSAQDADAGYRMEWLKEISATGAGLIAVHMRCHGASRHATDRRMGEHRLKQDTAALIDYLQEHEIPSSRLIIAGESMGGALAAMLSEELTRRNRPPAVVGLISTFASMAEMIYMHLQNAIGLKACPQDFITKWVKNPLDTAARVEKLNPERTSIYIASTPCDEHIPFTQHEKICDAAQAAGFDIGNGTFMLQEWHEDELRPNRDCNHIGWDPHRIVQNLQSLYEARSLQNSTEEAGRPRSARTGNQSPPPREI